MQKRVGKITEIVNEDDMSKTVIEFENLDDLEKGIRKMLGFAGYEDCSFYIHQHVNRIKNDSPRREIGGVNSIFTNGFYFNSYNSLGQSVCRMGAGNLYVGENTNKTRKVNEIRDEVKQNGTLLDLLTFDVINYDYEGFLSAENSVCILAMPKYINVGENKYAPFGLDCSGSERCYDECMHIPYCEMAENKVLTAITKEKYGERNNHFIKSYCKKVANEMGVTVEDFEKLSLNDLFKLDKNDFFKSDKFLSVLDDAFEETYLKDGKVYFEKDFKYKLKDILDVSIKRMASQSGKSDYERQLFRYADSSFVKLVEDKTDDIINQQHSSANIDKRFVLGNIAFGSEEYGFKPLIELNNNFFVNMDKERVGDFLDTFKVATIKFGDLDPKNDNQEKITQKVVDKTKESYDSRVGSYREGSYASDFDFY